ncbi:hypothetical protein OG342_14340 [Streptomyces bobili]|uniref:site-specific integrase n=1 Tax=Streptomyces bobili TaxID=67280 RepID=UPI00225724CA|nr:hypothetical protein [Streptomyces bobili]MCX5524034.1 hypothetical protein [Streptomyces bobili]
MTTPRPASSRRTRSRANGDGTVYQRKDGRWDAPGYVLAPGNTRKRVRVYGASRKEALAKLTEKIAVSNLGLPVAAADSTVSTYLTYWLNGVAVHHVRENTHTRYATCIRLHLILGLGTKSLARLTAKDVRILLDRLRTTCQCCAQGLDAARHHCCAIGECCGKQLSPLTVTYVLSVLKSALEHAVHEDELPRNVARNVKTTAPRPRRFTPLTAAEARQLLLASKINRLHALYELALHTGLYLRIRRSAAVSGSAGVRGCAGESVGVAVATAVSDAGRTVALRHLLIAGTQIKSVRSHLPVTDLAVLAARGGRAAGPSPLPAGDAAVFEVDRVVNNGGLVGSAGRQVLAAEILGGRQVGIRIDDETLSFFDPSSRELLRVRPNPLTARRSSGCAV